jgi:hypothetical protein
MKNKLKYFIAVGFFYSTLAVFAQPGEGNGSTGNDSIEGGSESDTTGAPIDDYVWVLAGLGLVYVWKLIAFAKKVKTK